MMETIKNNFAYSVFTILGTLLLYVGLLGCKKEWLEAKPDQTLAVPSSVRDFQAMLDNYSQLNANSSPILGEIAADGHYYKDADFAEMAIFSSHFQNAYTWTNVVPYENISDYYAPYGNVLYANIILNELEKSLDQDKNGLKQVKAQALFYRAKSFFELSQIYAQPYKKASAETDLGIALRLSTDIISSSIRVSVKQTYDQIIEDLIKAKDVLPASPLFLTRVSQPAVLGLLAKVYLVMGEYKNALIYANEYLKIKNTLLDYNTISTTSNFIGINSEVAFLNFLTPYREITSQYFIDQALYDSYDNDDLRKLIFFRAGPEGVTFKGYYSNSEYDVFAGISTDEMYLIRAEGYARTGNIPSAMKDLNDLLRTRWRRNSNGTTTYKDQLATSETDALEKILKERKKQLILRNVRWSDLRRLNQEDRFKIIINRTVEGRFYSLEPNSFKLTFPYPIDIIQKTNMEQNLGW